MHRIAKRRGWDDGGVTRKLHGIFEKHMKAATAAELHGLIIEASIDPEFERDVSRAAKLHGIDINALEKAAIVQIKTAEKKPQQKPRKTTKAKG